MTSYRPEIDGLRAVAVMAVVLFHAGLPGVAGGFMGVDVFFVISGYLITSILLAERARGDFSFRRFYARRVRRILPLMIFVCLACLPPALLWLLPGDMKDFSASLVGAATFTLNLIAANNVGYFDRAAEAQPLLHIWSLSVEEQFYLLFPLLLAGLWRFGRGVTGWVIAALIVAGVVTGQVWAAQDAGAAFYLLPSRGWTILIGAGAALIQPRVAPQGGLAGLGLAMVLGAVLALDSTIRFPGVWALLPTVGAALVILFAGPATWVGRVLALRPMVALGLISYGIYLWHNPVMAFARYGRADEPPAWIMAGTVVLTLGLAAITWRLVEQPFRAGVARRRAVPLAVAGSVLLVVIGVAGVVGDGWPSRFPPQVIAVLDAAEDRNPQRRDCTSNGPRLLSPDEACVLGEDGPLVGVLMGDSHADALSEPLAAALTAKGIRMAELTYAGCPLLPGLRQTGANDSRCEAFTTAAFDWLEARPEIGLVVLHARFALYLQGVGYDNGAGGVEHIPPAAFEITDAPAPRAEADRQTAVAAAYRAGVDRLLRMGKRVVLITPVPEAGWDVPRHMALSLVAGDDAAPVTDAARMRARMADSLAALIPDPLPTGLSVIRTDQIFCDADLCRLSQDGIPLYADADHLTNRGAALVVDRLVPYLPAP